MIATRSLTVYSLIDTSRLPCSWLKGASRRLD
jgi:hypothetical protein